MKFRFLLLISLLWVGLTGCSSRVQTVQPVQSDRVKLDAFSPAGQSFVARYAGLNGVQVYLSPDQAGDGELVLRLKATPDSQVVLASAALPLSQVTEGRWYNFDFQVIRSSNQQSYYASLEITGEGSLLLAAADGTAYLDGAMYQGGTPTDAQLAFSLTYHPGLMIAGLVGELLSWIWLAGLSALLFVLPGWVILGWAWSGWEKITWTVRLGLAGGVGLALAALLMAFSDALGLHLGAWNAWLLVLCGVGGVLWQSLKRGGIRARIRTLFASAGHPWQLITGRLPEITLGILVCLLLVTRWWAVRELDTPLWGDSVQHTFITQLILDNGGLFASWEPYTPYATFSNQFGFSAAAAMLAWVSGLEAQEAVLWSGQILNILAILALIPITMHLARGKRWAGVGMVLAAGLLSPMPAYYFNWGRYAQLAGQVLLPVVLWMLLELVDGVEQSGGVRKIPWRKLALTGITLGGMVMYQYRMPFYVLTFGLACVVAWWLPSWRLDWRRWLGAVIRLGLAGLVGVLCFLPWGVRMFGSDIADLATTDGSVERLVQSILESYQGWETVYEYLPIGLAVAAMLAWIWGVLRKQYTVVAIGIWVAGLASIFLWTIFGVPGAAQVAPFTVMISLYLPAGILTGWLAGEIGEWLGTWRIAQLILAVILVGAGAYGAWGQRGIAEPENFALVTRPDVRAMTWIRENTDPEAYFLVEGFRAYYNTAAVGSDAGWWIPLLAGRANSMPPLYALGSEVPWEVGYSEEVVALTAALETVLLNSEAGVKLLCDAGVTHVYIGQRQGLVGATWLSQSFTPQELLDSAEYELVYQQDRVYIFALRAGVCQ